MLTRRNFIRESLGTLWALSNMPVAVQALASWMNDEKKCPVDEIYQRAVVIDALTNDGPGFDAQRAISAGLTAAVVDLPIYPRTYLKAVQALQNWTVAFRKQKDRLIKVTRAADFELAKKEKRLGIVLACQDASILDASTVSVYDFNLDNLQFFYAT